MKKKLEKKSINQNFFKAIQFFFNLNSVKEAYNNDYYLIKNFRQFITLLWEETSKFKISFFFNKIASSIPGSQNL